MDRGLKAPLSPNEEITLRRVAYGIAHRDTMRAVDVLRLETLGLIAESDGVLGLTPMGQQRVAGLPATKGGSSDTPAGDPYVEALAKALGIDKR